VARVEIQLGHCYRTTGATGTSGCCGETEQQYVTRLWQALEPKLRSAGHVPIRVLADPPAYPPCDVFVALHCDGSVDPSARGCSFGYNPALGNAAASRALGDRWRAEHNAAGYPGGNRATNYTADLAGYYALRHATAAGADRAIVVELGFLTNRADNSWLTGNVGRVADVMVRAVAAFYGGTASKQEEDLTVMDDATKDYLDDQFRLLRVGDRQGGDWDTHDFSSIEGTQRKIDSMHDQLLGRLELLRLGDNPEPATGETHPQNLDSIWKQLRATATAVERIRSDLEAIKQHLGITG